MTLNRKSTQTKCVSQEVVRDLLGFKLQVLHLHAEQDRQTQRMNLVSGTADSKLLLSCVFFFFSGWPS